MTRANKSHRRKGQGKPKQPLCVVTREGNTTIRQFHGGRFVEFRGKRVARVEFYTWGSEHHSISVHFQDRTAFYLTINPMFTIKPRYYRVRAGELETMKEWPELKTEQ